MKTFFQILMIGLFIQNASAQISADSMNDLIADLTNYSQSNCQNSSYAKSAQNLMNQLNSEINATKNPSTYSQFTEAKKGFIDFQMDQLMGQTSSCKEKIGDSIKKLKAIGLHSPGSVESKKATSKASGAN